MSIQVKRGMKKDLPQLKDGELAFCKDTKELYVGNNGNENVSITKKIEDRLDAVDSQLTHMAKINIKDFGAKGDGVSDDTNAIQEAIDSIKSVGGSIYFPKCSDYYNVTSNIELYSNIDIIGDECKPFIKYKGSNQVNIFNIENCENITIKNISIYNGGSSESNHLGENSNGINIYNSKNIEINNCFITEIGGMCGIKFRKSKHLKVFDTDFYKCTYSMLSIREETEDILVDRCSFDTVTSQTLQNTYTICTGASDYVNEYSFLTRNLRIFNSKFINNPRWEGIDTHGCFDLQICNNYIENVQTGIMVAFDVRPKVAFEHGNIIISNNIIKKGLSEEAGNGIVVQGNDNGTGEYAENITISNNIILGSFGNPSSIYNSGLNLSNLKNVNINNNTINGCNNISMYINKVINGNINNNNILNTSKGDSILTPVRFETGCWLVKFKDNTIKNSDIPDLIYRGIYSSNIGLVEYDNNTIINAIDCDYHVKNAMLSGVIDNENKIGKVGYYVKNDKGVITHYCTDKVIRSVDKTLGLKANTNGSDIISFNGDISIVLCPGQEIMLNNVTTIVKDIINSTTIKVDVNVTSGSNLSVKTTNSTWEIVNSDILATKDYAKSLSEIERGLSVVVGAIKANSMVTKEVPLNKIKIDNVSCLTLIPYSSLNGIHYTHAFSQSTNKVTFRFYNPSSVEVTPPTFNFSVSKTQCNIL